MSLTTSPTKSDRRSSPPPPPRERIAGPVLRAMRHFWPTDRFLWPAARLLVAARSSGDREGWFTTADGFWMELSLGEYPDGSMYFGVYEAATIRLIRRLVRPGDAVIDVGGNIGYITLQLARCAGPRGAIHTFEPVAASAQRIEENVRTNGLENVRIHRAAVGAQRGEIVMYTFGGKGDSRHVLASMSPLYEERTEVRVPVEVLDEVVSEPVRLIKVDVEGAEVGVLRGASRIIREHRPHLIVENNPQTLAAFGHTFADVLAAIGDAADAYEVASIDGFRRRTWAISTPAPELPVGNLWIRPK